MDISNWQASLPDNTPFSTINMPGTHNSSTQFVNLSLFSRCQHKSILQQLEMGARLLDIRLTLGDEGFATVHGISNCRSSRSRNSALLTFDMIFNDVKTFLELHPTEAVLVGIKMDRGENLDIFFPTFYSKFIEAYSTIWFLENRIPTLGECRGKLVLIRRCDLGQSNLVFNDSNSGLNLTVMSSQEDATSPGRLLPCPVETMDGKSTSFSVVVQDDFMLNPIAKWNKAVQPMLENAKPDNSTMTINFLSTAGFPYFPCHNARYVNSKFNSFNLKSKRFYGWLVFDFLTEKLAVKTIESNF